MAIAQGEFRADLFYRLNVINIHVPPLRERKGDVDLLVKHFIGFYGKKSGKRIRNLDANFRNFVKTYHWPGNVRELQNLIERAAILTDSDVLNYDDVSDTPLAIASPPPSVNARRAPAIGRGLHPARRQAVSVDAQRARACTNAWHWPQGALGAASAVGHGEATGGFEAASVGARLRVVTHGACFVAKPCRTAVSHWPHAHPATA